MRALIPLALAGSLSGCGTFWVATQALGAQSAWDEGVREVAVPQPGVEERLAVSLPLATEYAQTGASPLPFALTCRTDQRAKDVVYHSAFRYGKRWKWMAGLSMLAEGAIAAPFIAIRQPEKPQNLGFGVYMAADALLTTGLFFIPRREIYRHDEHPIVTPVRSDCPEGMTLAIGGARFPVDAAGKIGEVGEVALDAWMSTPTGPLLVEVAGQTRTFEVGYAEQCVWLRDHHRDRPTTCTAGVALRSLLVAIEVPVGTLSTVAGP